MTRVLVTYILPLLLPSLLYILWLMAAKRLAGAGAVQMREVPWVWLFAAGLALAGVFAGGMALMGGSEPGKVYRPAYVDETGELVPGRTE